MFMALMAIAMVGCEYDDSGILSEIESLKNRVQALEQLCAQSNTNIASLQALVEALQQRDYVKSVAPIAEGDKIIGYTITFAKGDPITIYHGKDGQDGQTPVVGVAKDEDGVYYWTLDGEWLTDDEGNNIPAIGGTPELKIKNDYWYVSYDGGDTWTKLGKATGETGATGATGAKGDSFFKSVTEYPDYVEIILLDDTQIILPRDTAFEDELAFMSDMANGGTVKLTKDITLSQTTVIGTGTSVVLDLNGHDLTAGSGTIENNGTLTIKGEYGKVSGSITRSANVAIVNKGTLIIQGGGYSFDPSEYITSDYKTVISGSYWYVIPATASALLYDSEVNAKVNGENLQTAIENASTSGKTLFVAEGYYEWDEDYDSRYPNKAFALIGLGDVEINNTVKYGMVLQSDIKDTHKVTIKNITLKGKQLGLYAKGWVTVDLYDVNCACTNGNTAILASSSDKIGNEFVPDVTTTINAYNVILEDGDEVHLEARPCYVASDVDGYKSNKTYVYFNYNGGNITDAICKPHTPDRTTGDNLFVNGTALPAYSN